MTRSCGAHGTTIVALRDKGIDYSTLKAALVPQRDRLERAYVFNTLEIDDNSYGHRVASQILRLVGRENKCSIKTGDLILEDQDLAFGLLEAGLTLHRACEIPHTSALFAVYLNNLTPQQAGVLHEGLLSYGPYIGYLDLTYASSVKTWLSMTLSSTYVKTGSRWIGQHEDDAPNTEDYNLPGWPLGEHGFTVASLQSMYFDMFLGYKIERPVDRHPDFDSRYAALAISGRSYLPEELIVTVDEAKATYLRKNHAGTLNMAGLNSVTADDLAGIIADRITHNYLYNLRFDTTHCVSLFNLILELWSPDAQKPTKLLAAMEYQPERGALRLVTLY